MVDQVFVAVGLVTPSHPEEQLVAAAVRVSKISSRRFGQIRNSARSGRSRSGGGADGVHLVGSCWSRRRCRPGSSRVWMDQSACRLLRREPHASAFSSPVDISAKFQASLTEARSSGQMASALSSSLQLASFCGGLRRARSFG